jgi:hypothetical protein
MKHTHRLLCLSIFLITASVVDLPQAGLAHGRRWHVRGCCLRTRSGGQAGRVGADADFIRYTMGASEKDEEEAIRKAVDFSTTARRQTVD